MPGTMLQITAEKCAVTGSKELMIQYFIAEQTRQNKQGSVKINPVQQESGQFTEWNFDLLHVSTVIFPLIRLLSNTSLRRSVALTALSAFFPFLFNLSLL